MRRALRAALEDARKEFGALLATMSPDQALEVLSLWEGLNENIIKLYGPDGPLLSGMLAAGESATKAIAARWSVVETGFGGRASAFLEREGASLVTAVTEETRAAVRELIAAAQDAPSLSLRRLKQELVKLPSLGLDRVSMRAFEKSALDIARRAEANAWSSSQFQFALNREYAHRMDYRARRIAITESSNAGNASSDFALREASASGEIDADEIELEWVTRVVNACPVCEALDGARRPIAGGFFVSRVVESGTYEGQRVSRERPTAHTHCYCGIRTVRKGR